ncbi:hypothetical protein [Nocardia wallacei]|uniref:hypothetical protein n=1 Tax=Nocardia wallacei TaxID=480035 RepID=UPI0024589428|nr:hypothetical protein [Nocardia wallacei]
MRGAVRAFLVTLSAAGILGATAATAGSVPTPTSPISPGGQVESCATTPSAVGRSCERPDPTLSVPSRAERGTQISVTGDNWRCLTARVTPSWSGAVQTAMVDRGSFDASLPVGAQVEPGSYSVEVSCGDDSATSPITIFARRGETTTPTTTHRTTEPTAEITTPSSGVETTDEQPSIAAQPGDIPQSHSTIGGPLVVVTLLAAVLLTALVVWWRRHVARTPHEPPPPRVRVRVVADANPSVRVRELAHPVGPAVRVRLSAGEPTVRVKEVPR